MNELKIESYFDEGFGGVRYAVLRKDAWPLMWDMRKGDPKMTWRKVKGGMTEEQATEYYNKYKDYLDNGGT